MILNEHSLKISSKGQITLPKMVRDILGTERIRIIVEETQVRIEPVKSVAGSLKNFARNEINCEDETGLAWNAVMDEQHAAD